MNNSSNLKKYGFLWVTFIFFLFSVVGHWMFAWYAYEEEQTTHRQPVELNSFMIETARDTLENWQSEFLQLIWQVSGLAYLWYVGSPQSKEGDDRKEEKLDEILRLLNSKREKRVVAKLDRKYPRK
jgi:hypothetical protein